MIQITKRNKQIKDLLVAHYGKGNVSVRGATGTATGWVEITLTLPPSVLCTEEKEPGSCKECRKYAHEIEREAEKMVENSGIELYTYADDMGYGDHSCIRVSVEIKGV